VGHGVAGQAHAAQQQEHAQRRARERNGRGAHQRAAHELELGERGDEQIMDHGVMASRPPTMLIEAA
jgi:hypothetical protein